MRLKSLQGFGADRGAGSALGPSFFALYSGRTREAYPGRANYGSVIHEFGWDGSLRAEHRLDADVIAIAWSEEDGLLYAARHDPVPEIVVYGRIAEGRVVGLRALAPLRQGHSQEDRRPRG